MPPWTHNPGTALHPCHPWTHNPGLGGADVMRTVDPLRQRLYHPPVQCFTTRVAAPTPPPVARPLVRFAQLDKGEGHCRAAGGGTKPSYWHPSQTAAACRQMCTELVQCAGYDVVSPNAGASVQQTHGWAGGVGPCRLYGDNLVADETPLGWLCQSHDDSGKAKCRADGDSRGKITKTDSVAGITCYAKADYFVTERNCAVGDAIETTRGVETSISIVGSVADCEQQCSNIALCTGFDYCTDPNGCDRKTLPHKTCLFKGNACTGAQWEGSKQYSGAPEHCGWRLHVKRTVVDPDSGYLLYHLLTGASPKGGEPPVDVCATTMSTTTTTATAIGTTTPAAKATPTATTMATQSTALAPLASTASSVASSVAMTASMYPASATRGAQPSLATGSQPPPERSLPPSPSNLAGKATATFADSTKGGLSNTGPTAFGPGTAGVNETIEATAAADVGATSSGGSGGGVWSAGAIAGVVLGLALLVAVAVALVVRRRARQGRDRRVLQDLATHRRASTTTLNTVYSQNANETATDSAGGGGVHLGRACDATGADVDHGGYAAFQPRARTSTALTYAVPVDPASDVPGGDSDGYLIVAGGGAGHAGAWPGSGQASGIAAPGLYESMLTTAPSDAGDDAMYASTLTTAGAGPGSTEAGVYTSTLTAADTTYEAGPSAGSTDGGASTYESTLTTARAATAADSSDAYASTLTVATATTPGAAAGRDHRGDRGQSVA